MAEAAAHARGEAVLRVVLTHLLANDEASLLVREFAGAFSVGEAHEAALPAPLRDALRACAERAAPAATLARLAVVSRTAHQLAAAAFAAPTLAACVAKAAALRDVVTVALDQHLFEVRTIEDEAIVLEKVLELCAPEAQLPELVYAPQTAGDAAAAWRALAAQARYVATPRQGPGEQPTNAWPRLDAPVPALMRLYTANLFWYALNGDVFGRGGRQEEQRASDA